MSVSQEFTSSTSQLSLTATLPSRTSGTPDAKHAAITKELATIKRMLRLLVHSESAVPGRID